AVAASFALLMLGWVGIVALALGAPVVGAVLIWPPRLLARLNLPLLGLSWRIFGLAAADVGFAGLSLYVLLPPGLIELSLFLTIFALALGAGLMAGTPGGVGPLELTLITFFPAIELELVAALLAFRLIYYVVPAIIAGLVFGFSELSRPRRLAKPSHAGLFMCDLNHGEARLAELGGKDFVRVATGEALMVARAAGALVAIGPLMAGRSRAKARKALVRSARAHGQTPVLYKCDGAMAVEARHAGWAVLATGREAVINPRAYSSEGPKVRQLRRKLKQVEAGGVEIFRVTGNWHRRELSAVAAEWAKSHGGERGFSMGHADALDHDLGPVFAARVNGKIVAFVSFLATDWEWTLDLMRHRDVLPPGVMYALVHVAVLAAREARVPRVSLASVPLAPTAILPAKLAARVHAASGAVGLAQFKSTFAPHWENRYIAAPSRLALMLGWLSVLRQITAGPARLSHRQGSAEVASGRPEPEWTRT
ncbi:MAG: phosphatidylglycerol lysyltransferase domain-containing protein, partial [Deltaproteobacteria bacterium]